MIFKAVEDVSTAFDRITNTGRKTVSTVKETNTASASSYTTVSDAAAATVTSMGQASDKTEEYLSLIHISEPTRPST